MTLRQKLFEMEKRTVYITFLVAIHFPKSKKKFEQSPYLISARILQGKGDLQINFTHIHK